MSNEEKFNFNHTHEFHMEMKWHFNLIDQFERDEITNKEYLIKLVKSKIEEHEKSKNQLDKLIDENLNVRNNRIAKSFVELLIKQFKHELGYLNKSQITYQNYKSMIKKHFFTEELTTYGDKIKIHDNSFITSDKNLYITGALIDSHECFIVSLTELDKMNYEYVKIELKGLRGEERKFLLEFFLKQTLIYLESIEIIRDYSKYTEYGFENLSKILSDLSTLKEELKRDIIKKIKIDNTSEQILCDCKRETLVNIFKDFIEKGFLDKNSINQIDDHFKFSYENKPNKPNKITEKIKWIGNNRELMYFFNKLCRKNIFKCKRKQQESLSKHFLFCEGKEHKTQDKISGIKLLKQHPKIDEILDKY